MGRGGHQEGLRLGPGRHHGGEEEGQFQEEGRLQGEERAGELKGPQGSDLRPDLRKGG